jgi:hypothetical protein
MLARVLDMYEEGWEEAWSFTLHMQRQLKISLKDFLWFSYCFLLSFSLVLYDLIASYSYLYIYLLLA